jgi:hypothetical protein
MDKTSKFEIRNSKRAIRQGRRWDEGKLLLFETLLEAFNTASDINKLLRAGEERMAFRADTDSNGRTSRTSVDNVSASASNRCLLVFRMDISFHGTFIFTEGIRK